MQKSFVSKVFQLPDVVDLIARMDAVALWKSDWEESKHPRADNGQFGSGSGSSSGSGKKPSKTKRKQERRAAEASQGKVTGAIQTLLSGGSALDKVAWFKQPEAPKAKPAEEKKPESKPAQDKPEEQANIGQTEIDNAAAEIDRLLDQLNIISNQRREHARSEPDKYSSRHKDAWAAWDKKDSELAAPLRDINAKINSIRASPAGQALAERRSAQLQRDIDQSYRNEGMKPPSEMTAEERDASNRRDLDFSYENDIMEGGREFENPSGYRSWAPPKYKPGKETATNQPSPAPSTQSATPSKPVAAKPGAGDGAPAPFADIFGSDPSHIKVDGNVDYTKPYVLRISGKTFDHRDNLKSLGFKWGSTSKTWYKAVEPKDGEAGKNALLEHIKGVSGARGAVGSMKATVQNGRLVPKKKRNE